ncbi:MAG: lipid-A-disaccharide synthase [Burkholderiaceae bacterium]|nr:lipid-A-disaccharide synthase [Burkholderiaceae bacterium]
MVAGEASGDLLAASVLGSLRRQGGPAAPALALAGIGGPEMSSRGFDCWWPSELLAVHGYAAALKVYPKLLAIRRRLAERLESWPARLFVGVDAPDFNLGLEARLRAAGVRTLHFVSPSIWAWRRERIETIRRAVDRMLLVFPFEEAIYRDAGIPALYCGHPLADQIPMEPDREGARRALGLAPSDTVVAVLPGSRAAEVAHIGPVFFDAVRLLGERNPGWRFVVPAAGEQRYQQLQRMLAGRRLRADVRVLLGQSHLSLAACDITLIASGTATLEAALFKRPMVIAYRMAGLSYRLMKGRGYLPYVGLPNILCGDFVVPEFIQDAATPAALADAVASRLQDSAGNERLLDRFRELHRSLACGCADRVAEAMLAELARSPGRR